MTLVLRKLLASSTFAIAGALATISGRLKARLAKATPATSLEEELNQDYEALDETAEEWNGDEPEPPLSEADRAAIQREITDLDAFTALAVSIEHNAKGRALLRALEIAFARRRKSARRRRRNLHRISSDPGLSAPPLSDSPFAEGIVFLTAPILTTLETDLPRMACATSENGPHHRLAYRRHAFSARGLFPRAGPDHDRHRSRGRGDQPPVQRPGRQLRLPWKPQRIEQRIGRCHRYGQQHDVVVVNFLNRTNAADQRVFQLLSEKFQLFEGVFGASDEVLGAIESGVDFEKRIAAIYQCCRRPRRSKPPLTSSSLN